MVWAQAEAGIGVMRVIQSDGGLVIKVIRDEGD